jgi:outer membrane protein
MSSKQVRTGDNMKLKFLSLVVVMAAASPAFAQKAGAWSASIGITKLSPDVTSGVLSQPSLPNSQSDVTSDTQLTGAVNYGLSDQLTAHIPLGYGFKHELVGAGNPLIAGQKLGEVRALPITAILQYKFLGANATWSPYVGGGMTYARFYKAKGTGFLTAATFNGTGATTLKIDSKFAPTLQLGLTYNINDKWYVDGSYTKTFLKTRTTLSTGQTIDTTLNPNGYTFQVGYKF